MARTRAEVRKGECMRRYVVVGAGAVGGALGALLDRAGGEVLLVARGEHGEAIRRDGLRVRCPDTSFTVHAPCIEQPQQTHLTPQDIIIVATKTQHVEAAASAWADAPVHDTDDRVLGSAGERLPVLVATNGVSGEEIALRYFDRVFGVCVIFPTVMIDPGEVLIRSVPPRGIFHIGRFGLASDDESDDALLTALSRDWDAAGLMVHRPVELMTWKYRKLLTNVGNILQALLADVAVVEDIRRAAEDEALHVLEHAGIAVISEEDAHHAWRVLSTLPIPGEPAMLGGSTWQSLVRGSGSLETDYLNGQIALIARRSGSSAPINARLAALARRAAREGAAPGDIDAARLRAELGR